MPRPDVEAGSGQSAATGLAAPLLDGPDSTIGTDAQTVSYKGIAEQFSWLGWAGFGGPSAHVSLFQKVPRLLAAARNL